MYLRDYVGNAIVIKSTVHYIYYLYHFFSFLFLQSGHTFVYTYCVNIVLFILKRFSNSVLQKSYEMFYTSQHKPKIYLK